MKCHFVKNVQKRNVIMYSMSSEYKWDFIKVLTTSFYPQYYLFFLQLPCKAVT